ncbi:hypothetical protein A8C35_04545 [Ligilactobacillus salivarius]|uniref:hypothetical protein n=1 Tax=Ligilactobacillus salivarius TaxID=1624 RepID=UPI000BAE7692|nr:hypothetical protein [Ligilactobacillus salivarius]PAY35362.1 hypothetical protein A8C35_04545 [Ligilactobacillus salivarius]
MKNKRYRLPVGYLKKAEYLEKFSLKELELYQAYLKSVIEFGKAVVGSIIAAIIAIFVANYDKTIYPVLSDIIRVYISKKEITDTGLKIMLMRINFSVIIVISILLAIYISRLMNAYRENSIVEYVINSKQKDMEIMKYGNRIRHRKREKRG